MGPNLSQLGRPKASKREAKSEPRRSKKREENISEVKRGLRSEKKNEAWKERSCYEAAGREREDQEPAKTAQEGPRPTQDRSKTVQDCPKKAQEPPKRGSRSFKTAPRSPKTSL